jgi:alpha-tubulin suppressor-like RCC1 family protein
VSLQHKATAFVSLVTLLAAPIVGRAPQTGTAQSVRTRSALISHTVRTNSGSAALKSWGDNSAGELGIGSLDPVTKPVRVAGLTGVEAFSAGNRFDLALMSNGTVVAWGANSFGQLGDGTTTYSALPVEVEGLSGVTAISAGGGHSLALLSNGTVMAWGDNQNGQLGDGSKTDSSVPVDVSSLSGVTAISAGSSHSMALLAGGTVDTWGYNDDGQLGDGSFKNSLVPLAVKGLTGITQISAGGYYCMALGVGGDVWTWGYGPASDTTRPSELQDLSDVSQVSAGWFLAVALESDGTVVDWQLATSEQSVGISDAIAVAGGGQYGVALLSDGTVEAWGDNALDQLGPGGGEGGNTPVVVKGLSDVTAISAGSNSSLALTSSVDGSGAIVPRAQPSIWQDVRSPNPDAPPPPQLSNTYFESVSAASPTDAWAVGEESPGLTNRAIAAHWNGSSWTPAKLPTLSGDSTFESVIDLAPGDAWAVGSVTGKQGQMTLTEHWNGTEWSVVSSPDPVTGEGASDQLTAIAGKGHDVWAFGDAFTTEGGGFVSVFLHLVKGSWQIVNGPNAGAFFSSATVIDPNDVWAVGFNESQTTFSVHWDGKKWVTVATPFLANGRSSLNVLTGVSADGPTDIWVSGYEDNVNDENFQIPYVLHSSGSGWTLVKVPTLGEEGSLFRSVAVLTPTDVWAVGQTQQNDGSILTLSEQFNGKTWSIKSSLDPGSLGPLVDSALAGVTSGGNHDLLSVGSQEELGRCCVVTLSLLTTKG